MLMEAGLSFLGLGVPPPTPSWGQMIGGLKNYLFISPWRVVMPSVVMFATVLWTRPAKRAESAGK